MELDEHMKYLQERNRYLEEVNRSTVDALHLAASLGDFQQSINKLQDRSILLEEIHSRIQHLITFQAAAFLLVNEEDNDFSIAHVEPEGFRGFLRKEVDALIENGTFAWALREKRPVRVGLKDLNTQMILHVMATSSRIRGMFVGLLPPQKTDLSEVTLSILSIILLHSANALESFELYQMLREFSQNLEKKANYRLLFEAAPDGVEVLNALGSIVDCNEAFESLIHRGRKEILGKHTSEFLSDASKARFEDRQAALKSKGYFEGEMELVCSDGSVVPVWRKEKAFYDEHMHLAGSVVYNHDLSRIRQTEKEKHELERQLQRAQAIESLGTLAGGIAHDFNNILAAIVGYTELAMNGSEDPHRTKVCLNQILSASLRAKDLVKQILAFGRKSGGEQIPLQMSSVVKEAMKLLRASIPTTIEIEDRISSASGHVLANPTQIHQVMMNLCTNAAHAMNEKGGVLEVSLEDVDLRSGAPPCPAELPSGSYVRLSVKDTGVGMSPEIRERIFEPYFTTKEKGVGTGLGLAVVHGIVKSLGGTITVQSEKGKGSVFEVFLPITVNKGIQEEEKLTSLPRGRERILFVDDEEGLVDIGKQILEHLGYRVDARMSSREAFEVFQNESDHFDLVITDMTMPKMTGKELAQRLIRIRPDIPIILCTGFSESISEEEARAMGIRAFIFKPMVIHELAVTVRRVLDQR